MPRRDDIVTIVIDAKNEMKRSIDGLGARVNDLERDLRAAVTTEIAGLRETALTDLKTSQLETRTSSYNAGKRASEAVAAVTDLRRDVDRLHHGLEGLREDVGKILEALRAVAPDQESAPRVDAAVSGLSADNMPGDDSGAARDLDAPAADEDEGDQPASEQTESEAEGCEEGDDGVPRAALEASEQGPSESVKEPSPLTREGKIWAIMRAGRVASATLICHRDTWEFVADRVGNHPHFRPPSLEERENGLVAAVLSGRSLVAMLLALYQVADPPRPMTDDEAEELIVQADRAMAYQVYYATARVLSSAYAEEGDAVVVTIDNRVPARA